MPKSSPFAHKDQSVILFFLCLISLSMYTEILTQTPTIGNVLIVTFYPQFVNTQYMRDVSSVPQHHVLRLT